MGDAQHPRGQAADVHDPELALDRVGVTPEAVVLLVGVEWRLIQDQAGHGGEHLRRGIARGLRQMRPGEPLGDHHGLASGSEEGPAPVLPEDLAKGAADLADRSAGAERLLHRRQQVDVALGGRRQVGEPVVDGGLVA